MKYTEGSFKNWGYELAVERYGAVPLDGGPWHVMKNPRTGKDIVIKDVIADAFLQQILMRPADYSVIATLNLNGDYISDALAAEVGGIGIAPGANIGGSVALFEATHGTAPKYAGQDKVNPGSLILSAEMMLRHMGWNDAADLVITGMEGAIAAKTVTYDFERLMPDATLLKCSQFGDAVIEHMGSDRPRPSRGPGVSRRRRCFPVPSSWFLAAGSRDSPSLPSFPFLTSPGLRLTAW